MHAKVCDLFCTTTPYSDGGEQGYEAFRSKQAAFPFIKEANVDVIALAGNKLWKELTRDVTSIQVTNVQLAFTGFEATESGQQSIDGFFKTDPGQRSLKRHRSENAGPSDQVSSETDVRVSGEGQARTSFVCDHCRNQITLQDIQVGWSDEQQRNALAVLRQEHEDFHFAQNLANGLLTSPSIKPDSLPRQVSKRSREVEPRGIAKYFTKK